MEKLIAIWQNMSTEQLVITLLIASQLLTWVNMGKLSGKYHQLDKLILVHAWIIKLKLKITTVEQHRNGDYEIVEPMNED